MIISPFPCQFIVELRFKKLGLTFENDCNFVLFVDIFYFAYTTRKYKKNIMKIFAQLKVE